MTEDIRKTEVKNTEARRIVHFEDDKLEKQFDELINVIRSIGAENKETKNNITVNKLVEPDKPDANILRPIGFTVTPGFKRMVLQWDMNDLNEIFYHQVEFAISHVDSSTWQPWQRISEPIKSHFWVHKNLDFNYEYRYRIRAVAIDGRYSQWSRVGIGGTPKQISLSEEIIGNLDYDNLDPDMKTGFDNIAVSLNAEDEGTVSAFDQASNQISSTVSEMYSSDGSTLSTIQQNVDSINFRVVDVDSSGDIIGVNSQITLGKVRDGQSYIYLEGDQITLDGNTVIDGTFEVTGGNVHITGDTVFDSDVTIKGNLDSVSGRLGNIDNYVEFDGTNLNIETPDLTILNGNADFTGSISGGSININNNFEVDSSGNFYASGSGEIGGSVNVKGNIYASNINQGTMDFDNFSVNNFSANYIEAGVLSAIEISGVYGTFANSLSAVNGHVLLESTTNGGVLKITDEAGTEVASLGSSGETTGSNQSGTMILHNEAGANRVTASINTTTGDGQITVRDSSNNPYFTVDKQSAIFIIENTVAIDNNFNTNYEALRVTGGCKIDGNIKMQNLPTSDDSLPTSEGYIWNDNGILKFAGVDNSIAEDYYDLSAGSSITITLYNSTAGHHKYLLNAYCDDGTNFYLNADYEGLPSNGVGGILRTSGNGDDDVTLKLYNKDSSQHRIYYKVWEY